MQLSRLALLALALAPAVSSTSCVSLSIKSEASCVYAGLFSCMSDYPSINQNNVPVPDSSFGVPSSVNFCTVVACVPGEKLPDGGNAICRDAAGEGSPASSTKLATAAIAAVALAGTVLA
ncbi:hypothetical protein TeGR_g1421 [Tetraparma gracilis]|uniref:Uncharacterized protein n=1 Tax=Tetraparma gracilis TaxID=2962635 RepID=A0ABQ6MYK6_9STRA|nr:hypothetical protein TeGR_g1421 [Tetraparma gracilis]